MKYEQTDFLDKLDEESNSDQEKNSDEKEEIDGEEEQKQEEASKNVQSRALKPDDGLDFKCEICQDAPGGCPSCGFGRNQ